jgi:Uma2 family endonuclease
MSAPAIQPVVRIPPLETGDRLTRHEFERRYSSMKGVKKAALIEGVVYMPSPVCNQDHGAPHFDLIGWLFSYRMQTFGVQGGDNSTLRLDLDNEPQPDANLRILPECGGQTRDEDGFIIGAPELIAEIAASSVSYDLHLKLNVYRRNGICEYVVWRTQDREIDWFVLRDGQYESQSTSDDGIYRSEIFPGLWLDQQSLLNGDLGQVMSVAQQGIETPEHAEFVARLRSRRKP